MHRWFLAALTPIIWLASLSFVATPAVAAADLNPPPPPDARCATTAHSTICTFSFTVTQTGVLSDISCPGFQVLENALVYIDVRRTYDQIGNVVEARRHYRQALRYPDNILYNSADPSKTVLNGGNWTETYTFSTPGDLSTAVLRVITGDLEHIRLPNGGTILQDAGRLTYDPRGDLTFEAGRHMLTDGDTARVCAALA